MTWFPRPPLAWALAVLLVLSLVAAAIDAATMLYLVGVAAVGTIALVDLLWLRRSLPPTVERRVAPNLPLGARQPVRLRLANAGVRPLRLQVHDHHPADAVVDGLPIRLELDAGRAVELGYRVTAQVRGDHWFDATDLALTSPLGLWLRVLRVGNRQRVRVFPNFGEVSRYTVLAVRNQLSAAGVRRHQRRGQGSDFHQLREFQQGDSLRQVDWKATARYRRPIAREYQDEQNQQLFLMLDCGRRMRHRDGGREHLDAALNAMLLVAHVAVKQGDAVGFMTFGGPERFMAPRKGAATLPALLRASYDVASTTRAADYVASAERFMARCLRRALVVVVTNTGDGDRDDLLLATRLLQTRHLTVVADMREPLLDDLLEAPVDDATSARTFISAQGLRQSRARAHEALRHRGVCVIDILPRQLPLALVNEYFDLKRSARL